MSLLNLFAVFGYPRKVSEFIFDWPKDNLQTITKDRLCVSNSHWTEWSTIQGIFGRAISKLKRSATDVFPQKSSQKTFFPKFVLDTIN